MIDFAPMRRMGLLAAAGCVAMMPALAILGSSPSWAAPNCVWQPNFKTAEGRHWYYRTDPATKRKCWYVKGRENLGQAAAKEPAIKPVPMPRPRESLQTVWNQLFVSSPLYDPPTRYTDADRPIAAAPATVQEDTTGDQTGSSDRRDSPPISAAYVVQEPPTEPGDERRMIAIIAVGVLLIALAAAAGVKQWRAGRVSGDRRAEYLALLSRALTTVSPEDRDARRDIYQCARRVLVEQLRAVDPPVGEVVITAELAALDGAIAQIELHGMRRHKRAPLSPREPAERAFTPRFGSGGTRPHARRRLGEIATWALRASRPA